MFNPKHSYFQWFELPPQFEVDTKALAERHRELQAEVHPDRVPADDEKQRMQAVQQSSLLNEAYATLMSPVKRAAYMLRLQGDDPEKFDQADLPLALLEEQMELRGKLEDLPAGDAALEDLKEMKREATEKLQRKQAEFSAALKESSDSSPEKARQLFHELQFLDKLLKEIDAGEEQRLGY